MNVFLIPGTITNFDATIRHSVDRRILERHLKKEEVQRIIEKAGDSSAIHCWAFKQGRQSLFSDMDLGDLVLFKESGTGLLGYIGEVCHKVHSITLGEDIWPDQAATPWEYIYFLKDLKNIDLAFGLFKEKLHYNPRFPLQGAISINQDKWAIIRQEYGSFEEFLKSFGSYRTSSTSPPKAIRKTKQATPTFKEQNTPRELARHLDKDFLKKLLDLDDQVDLLKKDPDHKERAHESLVESFFHILGYYPYTDIKHQQGRVDISVRSEEKTLMVVEVKKDWNLTRHDTKVVRQAFNYALETGSRYVIITNGDYYAVFDRDHGMSYNDMLIGEFRISEVPPQPPTIAILHVLQKRKDSTQV